MTPAAIFVLASLPLLPNGKIDLNALPETGMERAGMNEIRVMPRTPTEELLSGIWQAVLGVSCLGIHDNFFDLGGHSLMATTVAARIRDTFQVEMPLRRLFERPTVATLAGSVDDEIRDGHGLHTPPIGAAPRDGELPLSFAQQRLWFLDQLSPGSASNNIPGGVRLKGALNIEALERSLGEIIRRHESLRTRLVTRRGDPVQVIDEPGRWALPVEDLSRLSEAEAEAEVQQRATADAGQPFDLSLGPLLRIKLLRLGPDEHALLVTMHHIISDGWSLGVFVQELATLYEAFCQGRPSPLPELSIQYGDYAVWQRTQLQGKGLERQVEYWKRQLKDAPPVLELLSDRRRPEKQRFRGAVRSMALSKDLTEAVKNLSRDENATLFMTLLAAFKVLLYHHSRQEDLVVGTDVANRNRVETENLIGFFVNQLVLRTDLSGKPAFQEILRRVREVTLDAYAHQDMPFDKLVEVLKPERSLKYSPIFQVKLVLQNAPMPPLELANLSLAAVPIKSGVSRFDLTLLFWEEEDGLKGSIEYNTDLFDATSIMRLSGLFETILQFVTGKPQASLAEIEETIVAFEREQLREEARMRAGNNLKRFQSAKPQVVQLAREKIVRTSRLQPDLPAPLVIEPMLNDADLIDWSGSNREFIERELCRHGALLFRGFNLALASEFASGFERFAKTICQDLFSDNGEHPRETVSGSVYTPVSYPADKKLLWHNENSFNLQWPMKIWFCCSKPADKGGETPVVDSRKVFDSISPRTRERFIRKGVMYVRNYGESLGLSWQKVFRTTSKIEVEERCRKEEIDFEWKDGDRLVTRSIRPAVGKHPRTGEMVWFNQAQHWHLSCLDQTTRESLQALFKEEDLPRNCYYGDGSAIDDSEMDEILDVYRKLEISFPWQKWDILMLDNMLAAHARNSFVGERKLLVAMGEMSSYSQV
jgi:alpha-ketoglutarate-dependent taurine dioxygenase